MAILHTLRTARCFIKGLILSKQICPDPHHPPKVLTNRMFIGLRLVDLFGHVNNSRYLEIFELSRWTVFAATGFNQKGIQAKIFPVVASFHVNYFRELKPFQVATIQTIGLGTCAKGNQMLVAQHLYDAKKRLCATGILHVPLIDFNTGKPVPIRDALTRMGISYDELFMLQSGQHDDPNTEISVETLDHWKKVCQEKGEMHLSSPFYPKTNEHIASHPAALEANVVAGAYLTEAAGSQRKWMRSKSIGSSSSEGKSEKKRK